jgi:hypothetical protein
MPVLEFRGVSKYFYRHGGRMLLRDRLAHSLGVVPRVVGGRPPSEGDS